MDKVVKNRFKEDSTFQCFDNTNPITIESLDGITNEKLKKQKCLQSARKQYGYEAADNVRRKQRLRGETEEQGNCRLCGHDGGAPKEQRFVLRFPCMQGSTENLRNGLRLCEQKQQRRV